MKNMEYHKKQFKEIKRSTVAFADWLEGHTNIASGKILDLGSGGGANVSYLGTRYPDSKFVGIEYDLEILSLYEGNQKNVRMEQGDLYNLDRKYVGAFDGVISLQVLSWLRDYKEPIENMCELNPKWIAMTSLFYDGHINFYISVDDHERNEEGQYNYNSNFAHGK